MSIWDELAKPFPFSDIEVKCQSFSDKSSTALATPYINARAAQRRLDEVFGPEGWSFEVRETTGSKGIIGRLTVFVDGKAIVREDGSEYSDIEPLKGGISGAFKRCFSQLGARSLYDVDLGWFACDSSEYNGKKKFKGWKPDSLMAMEKSYEKQLFGTINREPDPPEPPQMSGSEQERNAGLFLRRNLKITKEQFEAYKAKAGDKWAPVALEAEQEQVTTVDGLMEFVTGREGQRLEKLAKEVFGA